MYGEMGTYPQIKQIQETEISDAPPCPSLPPSPWSKRENRPNIPSADPTYRESSGCASRRRVPAPSTPTPEGEHDVAFGWVLLY